MSITTMRLTRLRVRRLSWTCVEFSAEGPTRPRAHDVPCRAPAACCKRRVYFVPVGVAIAKAGHDGWPANGHVDVDGRRRFDDAVTVWGGAVRSIHAHMLHLTLNTPYLIPEASG